MNIQPKEILNEFKAFAMRGNVIDLAVGVVIGTAFGKIVSALVDNVIMPPLGVLIGGVDFSDLGFTLVAADPATKTPAVIWGIGAFIQACFNFLIIAAAIFFFLRVLKKLVPTKPVEAPPPPTPKGPTQEELLAEIRDLLKKQK